MFNIADKPVYGQSKNNKTDARSGCSIPTPETLKKWGRLSEDQEVRYRSPIRYIVIYNDIGPTEDRRIEMFMNVENINEKDLRTVFCWIAERYPSPIALSINVHTNLDTIETPDERELLRDGDDSRFSKYYGLHREADYHRYDDGLEAFGYTTRLSPYRVRQVVIKGSK